MSTNATLADGLIAGTATPSRGLSRSQTSDDLLLRVEETRSSDEVVDSLGGDADINQQSLCVPPDNDGPLLESAASHGAVADHVLLSTVTAHTAASNNPATQTGAEDERKNNAVPYDLSTRKVAVTTPSDNNERDLNAVEGSTESSPKTASDHPIGPTEASGSDSQPPSPATSSDRNAAVEGAHGSASAAESILETRNRNLDTANEEAIPELVHGTRKRKQPADEEPAGQSDDQPQNPLLASADVQRRMHSSIIDGQELGVVSQLDEEQRPATQQQPAEIADNDGSDEHPTGDARPRNRNRARLTRACDICKAGHLKCTKAEGGCKNCNRMGQPWTYRVPRGRPGPKGDVTTYAKMTVVTNQTAEGSSSKRQRPAASTSGLQFIFAPGCPVAPKNEQATSVSNIASGSGTTGRSNPPSRRLRPIAPAPAPTSSPMTPQSSFVPSPSPQDRVTPPRGASPAVSTTTSTQSHDGDSRRSQDDPTLNLNRPSVQRPASSQIAGASNSINRAPVNSSMQRNAATAYPPLATQATMPIPAAMARGENLGTDLYPQVGISQLAARRGYPPRLVQRLSSAAPATYSNSQYNFFGYDNGASLQMGTIPSARDLTFARNGGMPPRMYHDDPAASTGAARWGAIAPTGTSMAPRARYARAPFAGGTGIFGGHVAQMGQAAAYQGYFNAAGQAILPSQMHPSDQNQAMYWNAGAYPPQADTRWMRNAANVPVVSAATPTYDALSGYNGTDGSVPQRTGMAPPAHQANDYGVAFNGGYHAIPTGSNASTTSMAWPSQYTTNVGSAPYNVPHAPGSWGNNNTMFLNRPSQTGRLLHPAHYPPSHLGDSVTEFDDFIGQYGA